MKALLTGWVSMILLAGCGAVARPDEAGSTTEPITVSSSSAVTKPAAVTTILTPTTVQATVPTPSTVQATVPKTTASVEPATTAATFPALVPPSDPSVLIGAVISSAATSVPIEPSSRFTSMLINGAPTNLVSHGGACLDEDCAHAAALVADPAAFELDTVGPTASYLLLESFVGRDEMNAPIWSVTAVSTIDNVPTDQSVDLLLDGCTSPSLPAGVIAIAKLVDWSGIPYRPDRLWAWNPTNGTISEVPIDPALECVPLGVD